LYLRGNCRHGRCFHAPFSTSGYVQYNGKRYACLL